MADDDLTVRARIDDELSRPLEGIREKVEDVGKEAEDSSRRAARSSRGWDTFGRATERAGKLAHTAGRLAKRALLGIGAGIAAAAYAAGRLAQSSIKQASDLAESLNAVNVTYGKQARAVKQLGREAAKSLGLSNVEFNGMAVQFAAFATAIGGEGKGAVNVLDEITTRAADFASVMNLDVAEAAALFQSGLAGESEPLRKYGINLSAAAVGAYAYAHGISESATEMTDAQKVQATYGFLMEQTAKTQGDFANTSDSLANQQRILGARFDNAQAKLGRGLLPVMQTGAKWLNREGIPAFLRFSDWFNDEGIPAIGRFVDKARTFYETHGPQIRSALADVRDVAREGAEAAKSLVDAFLGMPSWARKALVGGAVGGLAAKKLGVFSLLGGLGKGGGGLLKLATKASPLPVYVVNNGIDLPGGGPDGKPGGKVPPLLAGGSKALNLFKRFGGPGALVGLSGAYAKRGVVDHQGNDAKVASPEQTRAYLKSLERVDVLLDNARAKAAGFSADLDLVGSRKVKPEVRADSITSANDALAKFIGYQIEAGRPVTPYLSINGYAQAMSQIATLTSALHSIPSAGVDNGVTYVGGGSSRPGKPQPPRPPRTTPNVVERAPSPRTAGNVTVAPGAIQVNNPASDVDLERAITSGIRNYVREREERG